MFAFLFFGGGFFFENCSVVSYVLASPTLTHASCHIHLVSQWVPRFLEPVAELECMYARKYPLSGYGYPLQRW